MAKKQLGDLDFSGFSKVLNLPDPASPQEPATKAYTDSAISSAVDPLAAAFFDCREPTGHVDRTQSAISFNATTRTFSIAPTVNSFDVYSRGKKITISSTLTLQIPNTSGSYFVYIDDNGALSYGSSFSTSILTIYAYTAYILWNAEEGIVVSFGDERHGITMDGITHGYLHTTRGTQLVSGASINYTVTGDGSSNSHAEISLSDMQLRDEDITANIVNNASPSSQWQQILFPVARIPIYYRNASNWSRVTATDYPVSTGTNRARYNKNDSGVWSLQEASVNGRFLVSYIFATTNISEPVIALLGQDEYTDLDDAEARAAWSTISFGDLPAQEMKLLYILVYETSSAFTNSPKVAIRQVKDLRFGADREVSAIAFNTSHANLSGLSQDDHIQYILEDGTRPFSGDVNLGSHELTNVLKVNGVVVESHASRHLPGGSDPLQTGTPINVGSANLEGTAQSYARSDHQHNHGIHGGGTLHAVATTSVPGFMSESDKVKLDGVQAQATANSATEAVATTNTTTTSTTDTLMTGMTLTPAAGSYLVMFSTTLSSNTNGAIVSVSLYSGGTLVTGSTRAVIPRAANATIQCGVATQAALTVTGSQAIEIRWSTSAGTATALTRSMTLLKFA